MFLGLPMITLITHHRKPKDKAVSPWGQHWQLPASVLSLQCVCDEINMARPCVSEGGPWQFLGGLNPHPPAVIPTQSSAICKDDRILAIGPLWPWLHAKLATTGQWQHVPSEGHRRGVWYAHLRLAQHHRIPSSLHMVLDCLGITTKFVFVQVCLWQPWHRFSCAAMSMCIVIIITGIGTYCHID